MVRTLIRLLPFFLLLIPTFLFAKQPIRSIEGTVTKVADGDTINVVDFSGTQVRIRLYGIDAPETEKANKTAGRVSKAGQPYGGEAWKALTGKVYRQKVKLDVMDIDRYKRLVCLVWLGGRNINQEMVAEGWAWAYRRYLDTPYASKFIGLEELARSERLGLWQQYNPQPPWEFRAFLRDDRLK
jgi:micrococcal nuclease